MKVSQKLRVLQSVKRDVAKLASEVRERVVAPARRARGSAPGRKLFEAELGPLIADAAGKVGALNRAYAQMAGFYVGGDGREGTESDPEGYRNAHQDAMHDLRLAVVPIQRWLTSHPLLTRDDVTSLIGQFLSAWSGGVSMVLSADNAVMAAWPPSDAQAMKALRSALGRAQAACDRLVSVCDSYRSRLRSLIGQAS